MRQLYQMRRNPVRLSNTGSADSNPHPLISAVAAMAVLIAGQLYGPRPATHLVTAGGLLPPGEQPQPAAQDHHGAQQAAAGMYGQQAGLGYGMYGQGLGLAGRENLNQSNPATNTFANTDKYIKSR